MHPLRVFLNGNMHEEHGTLRIGNWKLIDGLPGRGDWYGPDPSLAWPVDYIMGPDATDYDHIVASPDMRLGDGGQRAFAEHGPGTPLKRLWLFDLASDPREEHDLSAERPDKVAELRERLAAYRAEALPPWDPPTKADARAAGPFLDPKTGKCCVVDWFDYSLAEKPRAKL